MDRIVDLRAWSLLLFYLHSGIFKEEHLNKFREQTCSIVKSNCSCFLHFQPRLSFPIMIFQGRCGNNEWRMLNTFLNSLRNIPEKPLQERYVFTGREIPDLNLGEWQRFMVELYHIFWDHSEAGYYLFGMIPFDRGCGLIVFRRKMKGNNDFSSPEKSLVYELCLHLDNFLKLRLLTMHWQKQGGVMAYSKARGLTKRETEISLLILKGNSIPRICTTLHISEQTVRDHLKRIYQKMNVHSKAELVSSYIHAWEENMKNILNIQPIPEPCDIEFNKK